jgi:hypothetical protein
MNQDHHHLMTPFDCYLSTGAIQMLKLLIPFLPPNRQRSFAIYVKFLEFSHTVSFFRGMRQNRDSPEQILDTLKPFIPQQDWDSFDQMMGMMSMMQEMPEMMAGMFTQEDNTEPPKEGESYDGLDQ